MSFWVLVWTTSLVWTLETHSLSLAASLELRSEHRQQGKRGLGFSQDYVCGTHNVHVPHTSLGLSQDVLCLPVIGRRSTA
jgi:hypothetical protein